MSREARDVALMGFCGTLRAGHLIRRQMETIRAAMRMLGGELPRDERTIAMAFECLELQTEVADGEVADVV